MKSKTRPFTTAYAKYKPIAGFSLVELSIVLVILGLLAGGILSGRSLIRAAELRGLTTESQRYVTAIQTFRDKYFSLPGDMTNATSFWGKDNSACTSDSGSTAAPGTCNGNGDSVINFASVAGGNAEFAQFWKHLALAGLIEGTYTGLAGSTTIHTAIGTTGPASRMSKGGWSAVPLGNYSGDAGKYAMNYGNILAFGADTSAGFTDGMLIKPEDAWNLDSKLDDGLPARGKIIASHYSYCTTSSSNTDYAGTYKLLESNAYCSLYFLGSM